MITEQEIDTASIRFKRLEDGSIIADFSLRAKPCDGKIKLMSFSLGLCDITNVVPQFWQLIEEHQKNCDDGYYKQFNWEDEDEDE